MLTQLIYSSRSTRNLHTQDLELIVTASERNNVLHGITGALCYSKGIFVQCFEGERGAVNRLYQHLLKDDRHYELEISSVDEIAERRFPNWRMGFFSYENEMGQLFLKHSRMAEFSPFAMRATDLNEFFDEVLKYMTLPNPAPQHLTYIDKDNQVGEAIIRQPTHRWG